MESGSLQALMEYAHLMVMKAGWTFCPSGCCCWFGMDNLHVVVQLITQVTEHVAQVVELRLRDQPA
jgi:hypothetical protein